MTFDPLPRSWPYMANALLSLMRDFIWFFFVTLVLSLFVCLLFGLCVYLDTCKFIYFRLLHYAFYLFIFILFFNSSKFIWFICAFLSLFVYPSINLSIYPPLSSLPLFTISFIHLLFSSVQYSINLFHNLRNIILSLKINSLFSELATPLCNIATCSSSWYMSVVNAEHDNTNAGINK